MHLLPEVQIRCPLCELPQLASSIITCSLYTIIDLPVCLSH